MSIRFACGAECGINTAGLAVGGGVGHWSVISGTPAIDTSIFRSGLRSYAFDAVGDVLTHALTASQSVGYVRFYFRMTDVTPASEVYICAFDVAGNDMGLAVTTGGVLRLTDSVNTQDASGITLAANEWFGAEIQRDGTADPTRYDWRIWSAATGWVNQTQRTVTGTSSQVNFGFGFLTGSGTTFYIDDIVIGASTTADADWSDTVPHGGQVNILRPTADLTHSFSTSGNFKYQNSVDFAQSATDVYTYLNSYPMTQSVDFISQNTSSSGLTKYCYIDFGPTESTLTSVHAVMPVWVVRAAGTSACEMNIRASDNGTNWTNLIGNWGATGQDVSETSLLYRVPAATFAPPSGGSWDQTKVNGLRMQFGMSDDISPVPYVVNLAFEVAWLVEPPVTGSFTANAVIAPADAYGADTISNADLTAYYRLGEASGTFAADISGNGHHGTYTGSPTLGAAGLISSGGGDTAVQFVADSYVQLTHHADLNPGTAFTLEFWVKRTTIQDDCNFYSKGTGGNFYGGPDGTFRVGNNSGTVATSTSTALDTARHHVVVTYAGSGAGNTKIYIDGVEGHTDGPQIGVGLASPSTNPRIGAYALGLTEDSLATIDELAIYNVVKTALWVSDRYTLGSTATATGSFTANAWIHLPLSTDALYYDSFDSRVVADGLGTSSDGNDWSGDTGDNLSVSGGAVQRTHNNNGSLDEGAILDHASVTDVRVRQLVSLSRNPTAFEHWHQVYARRQAGSVTCYVGSFEWHINGDLQVRIDALNAGVWEWTIAVNTITDAWTDLASEAWWLEIEVTGTADIELRAWKRGTTRPSSPTTSVTDSTSPITGGGRTGFRTGTVDTTDTTISIWQHEVWDLGGGVGSLTADAVIKKTATGSISADAVARKTQAGSLTADAVVKRTQAASLTADAVIKRAMTGSFSADAVIKRAQSGSLTANAALRRTQSAALTADAIVKRTQTGSATANAAIKKTATGSLSADAIVKRTQSGSLSGDSVVKRSQSASATADSVVKRSQTGSLTADAAIRRAQSGTLAADAVIKRTQSSSLAADAILKRTQSGSFVSDAVVLGSVTSGLTASAVVLDTQAGSLAADAVIKRAQTGSLTTDAILEKELGGSLTAEALLVETTAADITADAVLIYWGEWSETFTNTVSTGVSTVEGSFTADAVVLRVQSGSLTADAVLKRTQTGSLTADAIIRRTQPGSLTSDAVLRRAQAATLTADAVVKRAQAGSFLVDAVVRATQPGQYTVDAVLRAVYQSDLDADAVIKRLQTGDATQDAVIRSTVAGSQVADAVIRRPATGQLSADAWLLAHQSSSVVADAVLFKTVLGSIAADAVVMPVFRADAVIRATTSGSLAADARIMPVFSADAVLRRTSEGSFTADTWIAGAGLAAFAADAVIFRAGIEGQLQAQAILKKSAAGQVTADAVIERVYEGALDAAAVVRRTQGASLLADAISKAQQTGSLLAEAILEATQSGSVAFDATLRRSQVGSLTADAVIRASHSASISADAVFERTSTASLSADAVVTGTFTAAFTADAWLRKVTTGSVLADAIVKATTSGSITASAWVAGEGIAAIGADAVLKRSQAGSFTSDACLARTTTGTLAANAVIGRTTSASITADAQLEKTTTGSFTADAEIAVNVQGATVTADAVLRATRSATLSADAVLRRASSAALLASAVIAKTATEGVTADAVIFGTRTAGLDATAVLLSPETGSLTADAFFELLVTGSFTADASIIGGGVGTLTADAIIISATTKVVTLDAWIKGYWPFPLGQEVETTGFLGLEVETTGFGSLLPEAVGFLGLEVETTDFLGIVDETAPFTGNVPETPPLGYVVADAVIAPRRITMDAVFT